MGSSVLLTTALSVFPLLIPPALCSSLTTIPPSIPPFDIPLSLTPVLVLTGDPSPYSTVECAASSASTTFSLRFISYGNYTALPSQGDDAAVPRLESVSFAVSNAANEVDTLCAFALPLSGGDGDHDHDHEEEEEDRVIDGDGDETGGAGTWQPCADRKDTDGTHRFTIATGAAFAIEGGRVAVNQTWFYVICTNQEVLQHRKGCNKIYMCYAEVKSTADSKNCTAPDTQLPVTLL
ncbi:hypothetical protein F4809DRAFT_622031 [Biscogniauxia mediterranea]|nr:hypothetical protein F4809DRAFT_622031 [Biscogniauxia mediterranea]